MTDEDIRKLLGGYATDTLSEEEQKALFEAALHDEKLFAALADEHALREMLDEPGHRAAVLQALQPAPSRWLRWMIPVGAAASLVLIASLVYISRQPPAPVALETAKLVVPSPAIPSSAPADEPRAVPVRQREVDQVEPLRDKVVKQESKVSPSAPSAAAAPPPPPPAAATEFRAQSGSAPQQSVQIQSAPMLASDAAQLLPVRTVKGMVNSAGKLQYTILKRGPDGQFKPVDPGSTFQAADAVRLNVEAEENGFLAVSQTEPAKILFQGVVQKQVPVTVPATGSLDLSNRGPFQITFSQPGFAGGAQGNLIPRALSKKKAMAEVDAEKSQTRQSVSKDQATQAAGTITVDVNLNVVTPAQQQK